MTIEVAHGFFAHGQATVYFNSGRGFDNEDAETLRFAGKAGAVERNDSGAGYDTYRGA